MKNFINRQKLRKALIIFSFLLLPATFAYISCPIIIEAASKGIASGGLIIFILFFLSSLFLGRLWCGWLCPGGGLQEIYFQINNKPVKPGRLKWLKYLLFLVIILVPLISAINSAGGIEAIEPFYGTENGIAIARAGSHIIFFVQIAFFTVFAWLGGKRGFCHYFCPIAVIMILGRKMGNIFAWPALHLSEEKDRCTDCRRCSESCPMSLDVNDMVRQEKMENSECILCGCCVDHCPESAIRYAWFG
ncbi:MAG: quinol dehydrogenase membrane component [Euryarchaeota archaeon ADurb.Bin190]|nr:MAG: quinol dehydrogenase membrane component [Euryarchaeota archaeon ADurb.Bin190]